jgi:type IVB pilus formation R64 PilN family outer membrane protein
MIQRKKRIVQLHPIRAAGLLAAMAMATTTGCSPGSIGQAERSVNAGATEVANYVDQSREPLPAAGPGRATISNDAYLPAEATRSTHGLPLPAEMSRVSVTETAAQPLPGIARTLSRRFQIPVIISPDMITAPGQAGSSTAQAAQPAPIVTNSGTLAAFGRLGANESGGGGDVSNVAGGLIVPPSEDPDTMVLRWDGPYSGLLDQICAKFGATYTYDGTNILISKNVTRTFTLHALADNTTLTETLSGTGVNTGSGGGGSGGGSAGSSGASSNTAQAVSTSIAIKVWDDITAGIASIIGKNGAVASLLSTGTITVTAPPPIMAQVQDYIDRQNRSLENEISISVQVLTLTLSNSDNNNFDLSAAIKARGGTFTVGNQTPTPSSTTPTTATGTVTPGVSIISGGTTAALTAISELGRVLTKTQAAVTTMNGFVAPFQLTNTRSYVAQQSVTNTGSSTGGAQTTTSLIPGTVVTGFNLAVLPRVDFRDRTVLMQYAISISNLAGAVNGFDVFTTPDGLSSIQLANVNQQAFINNAEVPDGDTVVVTGYNQDQDTANKTGFLTPGFWGLSGTQYGSRSRSMTVVLITPKVLRVAHSPITTSF